MIVVIASLIAVAAAGLLGGRLVRSRIARHHRQRGEVEAALRPHVTDDDGGRRRWRHVVAVPSHGELRVRARPGSLGLRGRPGVEEVLVVQSAEPDDGFRVRGRDAWFVGSSLRAVTLRTPEGPMTLLLQPGEIPSVLARLAA